MTNLKDKIIDDELLENVAGGRLFGGYGNKSRIWSATEENERIRDGKQDTLDAQGVKRGNSGGSVGA